VQTFHHASLGGGGSKHLRHSEAKAQLIRIASSGSREDRVDHLVDDGAPETPTQKRPDGRVFCFERPGQEKVP
jgi:hypothetical protein